MNSDETTKALDKVFEAAIVPGLWHDALDLLAVSIGAVGAAVVPRTPQQQALGFPVSQSAAEFMDSYLKQGWYLDDVRGQRAWPSLERRGGVVLEQDISSEDERKRLPYYQEFCRPFRLPWWAAVGFRSQGEPWAMALYRDVRHGAYQAEDVSKLEAVAPHLRRMVTVATRFRQALEVRTLEAKGADAILSLDQRGLVVDASTTATALLGEDLYIWQRRLTASDPAQNRRLGAAIADALSADSPATQKNQRSLVLRRTQLPPLVLEIVALPAVGRDVFSRAMAFVTIRVAGRAAMVAPDVLRETFGLTPAECELALLIAEGQSPREVAARLGISFETARTVLKRVFAKLEVSRQSELAALLARLSPR